MRSKRGNILVIVLAGILLFAVSVAVFFFWQNQQKITPTQVSTPQSDETSNWKIYTNDEYSFQFKYPDTLYIDPKQETSQGIILLNNSYKDRANHLEQPFIQVDVTKGNLEKIMKDAQEIEKQFGKKILADAKPITIDGHQGYKSDVESPDGTTITVQLQNGEYIYGLMFVNVAKNINPQDLDYMIKTFNQILPTLKFI